MTTPNDISTPKKAESAPRQALEPKLEAKLHRAANQLNALLAEVRKTHPQANYYVDASNSINLMSGPPHDERDRPRQDRILASARVHGIDGGDW